MDFRELLKEADYNKEIATQEASVERYSSDLPPPKKVPKSNVQSSGIKKFLEKKKAEEEAKLAEARKQKEKLLALRAQSSKNSKKAKIMASRTKDNDFSKIKLTDDEIEAKKKREAALIRQNLANKVERMKARIEMEEKEAMLPRKRKRKSKNGEVIASHDDPLPEVKNDYRDSIDVKRNDGERISNKSTAVQRKLPKPPSSTLSFMDLLKIAEKKQHEPLDIVVPQKDDEKLMTKKERKLKIEEEERLKRKKEREFREKIEKEIEEKLAAKFSRAPNIASSKSKSGPQTANISKKLSEKTAKTKNPTVVHVERDVSKPVQEAPKFKIPKGTTNTSTNKNVPVKTKETSISANTVKFSSVKPPNTNSVEKTIKSNFTSEQKMIVKPKIENNVSFKSIGNMKKAVPTVAKKNGLKINPVSSVPVTKQPVPVTKQPVPVTKQVAPVPQVDEAALEQRIREKLEREIEERIAAKFGLQLQNLKPPPVKDKTSDKIALEISKPSVVKKEPAVVNQNNKKVPDKPTMSSQKDIEKMLALKRQAMEQKNAMRKMPEKKPFHKNPYLDPPRRLLEPQRPRIPAKRRIESDSDDDDDDDMSDFIDDGPSQNEDDYSKYIQEIFGYDRNKYLDNDDDDIMETSFAEQMKEEIRSAKAGYLEDLEEEKKERARMKKKKLKK